MCDAYTHVFHELLRGIGLNDWDSQGLDSAGCRYFAPVAVSLLAVVVILLYKHITATVDGGEETYRWQICRAEQECIHQL